jgi:hypothetical protein
MNENRQQHLSVKLNGLDLWTHYSLPIVCAFVCVLIFSKSTGHDSLDRNTITIFLVVAVLTTWMQTHMLRFTAFTTNRDASVNYHAVMKVIKAIHWKISKDHEASKIIATVPGFPKSARSWGERVEIQFDGNHVYVNSICDPRRWAAITAWGRNSENVELIRHTVMDG